MTETTPGLASGGADTDRAVGIAGSEDVAFGTVGGSTAADLNASYEAEMGRLHAVRDRIDRLNAPSSYTTLAQSHTHVPGEKF